MGKSGESPFLKIKGGYTGVNVRRGTSIWNKWVLSALLCAAAAGCMSGCAQTDSRQTEAASANSTDVSQRTEQTETASETETVQTTADTPETTEPSETLQSWEETDQAVWFSHASGFYRESISVALRTADGAGEIHYTTDGSIPDAASPVYEEPVRLAAGTSDFPDAVCIQAAAVYDDGTVSQPVAHHYFVNTKIDGRFTTLVFAVSGDPADLTQAPDGIFFGGNYGDRGRDSERAVYVEAYSADGERLLAQYAGVRVYGGASREASVKSMKLFARKSYDPDNGKFRLSVFGTEDAAGDVITKYDKLVLRNAGNDFQFAYIRDELAQTLAEAAGFSDYEAVVPAVGYLNGAYYGYYWLHESYCDDYFKEKYGDAEGAFVIIEGGEQYKNDSDDEAENAAADEYRKTYRELCALDLTQEEHYGRVAAFMDVENYLDYYAFNIYVSNKDWPNNNYKCYRYEPLEGETAGTGVFDGRWRYLLHDVDYTFGLYDQRETKANYDTLAQVMKEGDDRYAPLFTALMERADCRTYFVEKTLEYMNGALSTASVLDTFEELSQERDTELSYYYEYLEDLRNSGDESIWTRSSHLEQYTQQIRDFAAARPEYMVKFLQNDLGAVISKNADGIYVLDSMSGEQ